MWPLIEPTLIRVHRRLSAAKSLSMGLHLTQVASYLGNMSTRQEKERLALLQGTLDLLILRTLILGPEHGQGIARSIQQSSQDELLVDHGALYPALQRLETQNWITAEWGVSENNRKARFYTLTKTGRKQLISETNRWRRLASAMANVLGPA
jgi:PadR family transcriptional regulator PadR